MSPVEIGTLAALLFGVAVGALAGMAYQEFEARRRRQAWREKNGARWRQRQPAWTDAADQLRIVMRASFSSQPLLNDKEARLFKELDRMVIARNPGWQVMAQVSLGEVLTAEDGEAYRCINSKRVDLLLVDEECRPRHAVEYQGSGHHQGTAAARDAVKKEALRQAGIGYHEVLAGHTTPSDLQRLVEKLVDPPASAPPSAPMLVATQRFGRTERPQMAVGNAPST